MGEEILNFYKNKIKKEYKIAFISTFIFMLLIHLYLFTNNIFSEDTVYNYYINQNMTTSGRWALSFFCSFSSYFHTSWLCGLLASIYTSLTMIFLIKIVKIKNPIVIITMSGLLVSANFMSDTARYIYTLDGYMIAMLLATLTVYLTRIEEKRLSRYILGCILLCLSCGIYQAYVSFALILIVFEVIELLLEGKVKEKECICWIIKQVIMVIFSLLLYYVIWKLCLYFCEIEAHTYLGISEIGTFDINMVLNAFVEMPLIIKKFFFADPNKINITPFSVLNIVFIIFALLIVIYLVFKRKLYSKKWTLFLYILCLLLFFPLGCFWNFVSDSIGVWQSWPRMLGSFSLIYILVLVLYEKYVDFKVKEVLLIILFLIIVNNSVLINISYYCMERTYLKSYADGLEMAYRIQDIVDEYKVENPNESISEIVFVGSKLYEVLFEMWDEANNKKSKYTNSQSFVYNLKESLLWDGVHAYLFVTSNFDIDYYQSWDMNYRDSFLDKDEVKRMGIWPEKSSVAIIDNKIIVKISNIKEAEV